LGEGGTGRWWLQSNYSATLEPLTTNLPLPTQLHITYLDLRHHIAGPHPLKTSK